MLRKFSIGLFALLLACMLAIQPAHAQGTPYVVTGDKPINARQCPRLDCSIVKSLAPGTHINVVSTVTGDTVFGSDQWMQVEDDSGEMFVHSALVQPASEEQPATTSNDEDSTVVDTSDWITHEVNHFRFLAPRMWKDIGDLATDEEFLDDIEDVFGKDTRDWYVAMQQACEDGDLDLVLVELGGFGALRFSHLDQTTPPWTPRYLKRLAEAYVTDDFGAEVVRSDVTHFPAGEGFRIIAEVSKGGIVRGGDVVYAVLTSTEVYYFELTYAGAETDIYAMIMDGVVNSFEQNPASM